MAEISLRNLHHSYLPKPSMPADYALSNINLEWSNGGAYALLGPSGCGKSTLLNIISGLLMPSSGEVLFDGRDVTCLPPDKRNIAQVFQFPVIYDTMSVYDNLAFPLNNRLLPAEHVDARVREVAAMLELETLLDRRAANLAPDNKQKISMGRGLVRDDVNVMMFDEPLTVIDPELKWKLRSKLKELHQRIAVTMIYVTHDQTEAMTFADQVVVMKDGEIVQIGTPVDLFERPHHTFVGHFIGSPGMNILPAKLVGDDVWLDSHKVALEGRVIRDTGKIEVGIRPEHVRLSSSGIPAIVRKAADIGRHTVVETAVGDTIVSAIIHGRPPSCGAHVHLEFDASHTRLYADGRIATTAGHQ